MSGYVPDTFSTIYGGPYSYGAVNPGTTVTTGTVYGSPSITAYAYPPGSYILLVHVVDSGANLAAFSQPNTVGNPWTVVDTVDYGASGPKIRVWRKIATTADYPTPPTFSVTGPSCYQALYAWLFQPGLIDPTTAPVVVKSSGFGTAPQHPAITPPSGYATRQRKYGVVYGVIAGVGRASAGWALPGFQGVNNPTIWEANDYGSLNTARDTGVETWDEMAYFRLAPPTKLPANGPNESYYSPTWHFPWVSMSILLLPWTSYATGSGLVSSVTDTYPGSTVDTTKATVLGSPTINGSGQLSCINASGVLYNGIRSFKDTSVAVEVPQATVTGYGQVQFLLSSQDFPNFNAIYMYVQLNSTTSVPTIYTGVTDNNSTILYTGPVYNATTHRWWRMKESVGCLLIEASPDGSRWTTIVQFEDGHGLLDDQLGDMQIKLFASTTDGAGHTGTATALFDNLNVLPAQYDSPVPSQRSLDWMGASTALQAVWHGHDVVMGLVDQGTTAAVRARQGITMLKRNYLLGTPLQAGFPDTETFPGESHGCLTIGCGVPHGGKYVEAVITANSGGSSSSTIASGILWCAQQGAKVISCSFGGGGDDPVFADTFSYIISTFDCVIFISSGNENLPTLDIPSAYSVNYPNVIHSVGAFDELTGLRAYFSNYSLGLSGVAPGLIVNGLTPGGELQTWSGTSAAAPHAANIAARLLTGGGHAPVTIGRVINQTARPTLAANYEQGNGAYDLSRAVAGIDVPEKTLLPEIAMPRFLDNQWADVAEGFDEMAQEVERKGSACLVRRVSWAATLANNLHAPIPWEQVDIDTAGGMWNPDNPGLVWITVDGLYEVTLTSRFHYHLADGTVVTGAPYNVGRRAITICYNGGDPVVNGIGTARLPASTDGEGVTLSVTAVAPFQAGDFLLGDIYQNSGGTIEVCQLDFCGTFMAVTRLAPLAPTLSGTATPVTGLTATATSYNSVSLAWTNSGSADQDATLIRRKAGASAPTSISDGTAIGTVSAPDSTLVDTTVAASTQYSYAAFSRSRGFVYASPATATVTTPAQPPAPGPITGLSIPTVTTASLGLTWTNPTTGGTFAGTMIRRNPGTTVPTGPTDGIGVADLAPGITSYTDLHLSAQTTYSYALFSHTADPVYAAAATASRATTVDVAMFGKAPVGLTSTRTDGPFQVGMQIHVSASAWLKAFLFYRPSTVVQGPWTFALWDIGGLYGAAGAAGVTSAGLVTGTQITYDPATQIGWHQVAPPTVPTLVAGRTYIVAVYVTKGLPETKPYWGNGGFAASAGLTATAGSFSLFAPSRAGATYTHAQCTYNTNPAVAPTTDGGADGQNWWIDALINPVT